MVVGGGDVEGDGLVIVQAFNAGIVGHKGVLACGAVEVKGTCRWCYWRHGCFQVLGVYCAIGAIGYRIDRPIRKRKQIRAVGFPVLQALMVPVCVLKLSSAAVST